MMETEKSFCGLEAQIAWSLFAPGTERVLEEHLAADYSGLLEQMEAHELLALVEKALKRLQTLNTSSSLTLSSPQPSSEPTLEPSLHPSCLPSLTTSLQLSNPANLKQSARSLPSSAPQTSSSAPAVLFIDREYKIRIGAVNGPEMRLRPLVKALFILFLKHPEGILLKERVKYGRELEDIYSRIVPAVAPEEVHARVQRLVNPDDNSFSEKASVLNARIDSIFPPSIARGYKLQGSNGHPRRIPLAPLIAHWL